ncbi:MAG: GspH/FimT family pseudopilin [Desulfobacterales bacterium]
MKNGFTLIELLVVLIIISLVSAFVAPRITAPLGNLSLKTASKKIVSALRYARSQAVSENEGRVAIFDFELRRLMLFKGSDLPPAYRPDDLPVEKAEMVYELPENTRFEQAVSGEEKISEGLFQLPFFPNGSSDGGELILTNEGGLRYRIKIDFITGLASLETLDRRADAT